MKKVSAPTTRTVLPRCQVSDDLLWLMNGRNNCFIRRTQNVTFSTDPCNLSGLALKAHSGVTSQEGLGVTATTVTKKVGKKNARKNNSNVMRFNLNTRTRRVLGKGRLTKLATPFPSTNFSAYSTQRSLTARSVVKVIKRGLTTYRPDLHAVAFRRVNRLHRLKRRAKNLARKEARAVKK